MPLVEAAAEAAALVDAAGGSPDVEARETGDAHEASIDASADAVGDARDATPDVAARDGRPPTNCVTPLVDGWTYDLAPTSAPWRRAFGDPHIDVGADQLFLTYDDVAQRMPILTGSYYFGFDLDLDGDFTFLVGISNAWVLHPAIIRAGNEIVLGGAYYSMPGYASVGSFTGQRLPLGRLRVWMFADAVTSKIALYVVGGGERRASGFVSVGQDVGGVLLIGNNAGAGDGPGRVGRLQGCTGLDESEVLAAYAAITGD
jgi:hypothetical protein